MRRLMLAILILIFAVDVADARRKRYRYGHAHVVIAPPPGLMAPGSGVMALGMHEPRAMRSERRSERMARGSCIPGAITPTPGAKPGGGTMTMCAR